MIAKIIATGSYLPEKILTNEDLSKTIETSDEWISSRSGIKERRIAAENEFTSDLATKAASDAINSAKISKESIDAVIVATCTPDYTFPSVANQVQKNLNIINAFCFDIEAACSGFVVVLSVAEGLIASGVAKRVLVIGAETFSKFINWKDRSTCVLFGDGAGAIIMEKSNNSDISGILGVKIHSDSAGINFLKTNGGVSTTQTSGYIEMNGTEIFRNAVVRMSEVLNELLLNLKIDKSDIDFLIPHQANIRIINAMAEKFNVPNEKVIKTIEKQANTSAASIPLALDHAYKNNIIKTGNLLAFTAIGAGLTWGAALVKW